MTSYRVLIVEDDRDSADSLADFLERIGFSVLVANTGPSGVAMALAESPDAMLCDINLPGLNGFELARQVKERASKVPVLIAITARPELDVVQCGGKAGFDHYFLKPADPIEVGGLLSDYANSAAQLEAERYRLQLSARH